MRTLLEYSSTCWPDRLKAEVWFLSSPWRALDLDPGALRTLGTGVSPGEEWVQI